MAMSNEFLHLLHACAAPPTRRAAEAQLANAEGQDAAQFMLLCAGVLRDRQLQVHARQLAGLLLKNAVCVGERCPKARQLARRWRAISEATKAQIRSAVMESLLDPSEARVRRIAALCCARIGAVDTSAGAWPEVVPTLTALTTSGEVPSYAAEEAMRALGFLAEEWQTHLVQDAVARGPAEQALASALQTLRTASLAMQIAAAKAIHALLPFASLPQLQQEDATDACKLLAVIIENCGPSTQEDLRKEALQCLACTLTKCYRHLGAALKAMMDSCLGSICSAPGPVIVQAIEVWTALAEHELNLLRDLSQGECRQFTQEVFPVALPVLCDCMTWSGDPDDEGEDDGFMTSGPLGAARICLTAMARVLADSCVKAALGIVETGLASTTPSQRRSGILAFGAILEGPAAQTLAPFISAAVPRLLTALKTERPPEAAAAAWALGRSLELHPCAVPETAQATLFEICIGRFGERAWLTEELCYCLDGLLDQQAAMLPPNLFHTVAQALLDASSNAAERPRAVLLRSLAELVARADGECVLHMAPVLCCLLSRAEAEIQRCEPPAAVLIDCLRALTMRIGAEGLVTYANRLLTAYIRTSEFCFNAHGGFQEEALRAAGTLAAVLGIQFEAGMGLLWPVLGAAVSCIDDREGCLAGLGALSDVVKALGPSFGPYTAEVLEKLGELLQRREDLDVRQRASALSCMGEIGLQLGCSMPGLPKVLELIAQDVTAAIEKCGSPISPSGVHSCEEQHWKVLDAALGAYEAMIRGCRQSGRLPSGLRAALPLALHLACLYGRTPGAAVCPRRLAVRLLGAMALEAPAEVVAFAGAHAETVACMQELASFGAACPSKAVRESAAAVAGLPLAATGVLA